MNQLNGITILVAEDDRSLLTILSKYLRAKGADVVEAENGRIAYELLKGREFDLVLSDVQMPQMTGIELLSSIRSMNPNLPVVFFVTGQAQLTEQDAVEQGAQGLMQKPFKLNELLSRIEVLIANRMANRA